MITLDFWMPFVLAAILVAVLTVVILRLVRGNEGIRALAGESKETQRAVRRAIRDGGTDDPEVDRLARGLLTLMPRLRWAKYFFGVMLALSGYLLIVDHDTPSDIVLRVLQILIWTGFIPLGVVNERRRRNYRGLTSPEPR